MNSERIRELMRTAYAAAAVASEDPNTQNGAILCREVIDWSYGVEQTILTELSVGTNRFPNGVRNRPERLYAPLKYTYMQHAEVDVILRSAKNGYASAGCILVCPYAACTDCARVIIGAGIVRVVRHKLCMNRAPERWRESIRLADEMLKEAKVEIVDFDESIGDVSNLFDGEIWQP